jgi:hypothetical protein
MSTPSDFRPGIGWREMMPEEIAPPGAMPFTSPDGRRFISTCNDLPQQNDHGTAAPRPVNGENQEPPRSSPPPTPPHPIDARTIPALDWLTKQDRWVVWSYVWDPKKGKWDKPPKRPNGRHARSNDPRTWCSFDQAWDAVTAGKFQGIGIMLDGLPSDRLAVIDYDDCRDPQTGQFLPWVDQSIRASGSYAEITPSQCGARLLGTAAGIATIHRGHTRHPEGGGFEIYANCRRYITLSGHRVINNVDHLTDITPQIEALVAGTNRPPSPPAGDVDSEKSVDTADEQAEPIKLEEVSVSIRDLILTGTIDGKPSTHPGKEFSKVVRYLYKAGHSRASVLATLKANSSGVHAKYAGRLEKELERLWGKLERKLLGGGGPNGGQQPDGLALPPGFNLNPTTGLWFQPEDDTNNVPEPVWICSAFEVVASTADDTSHAHGLLIQWIDDNNVRHTWALPRKLVHAEGNILASQLEDAGLHSAHRVPRMSD